MNYKDIDKNNVSTLSNYEPSQLDLNGFVYPDQNYDPQENYLNDNSVQNNDLNKSNDSYFEKILNKKNNYKQQQRFIDFQNEQNHKFDKQEELVSNDSYNYDNQQDFINNDINQNYIYDNQQNFVNNDINENYTYDNQQDFVNSDINENYYNYDNQQEYIDNQNEQNYADGNQEQFENNQNYYDNQQEFFNETNQQNNDYDEQQILNDENQKKEVLLNYENNLEKNRTFYKDGVCFEKNDPNYVSSYFNQNNLGNLNEDFVKIIESKNNLREKKVDSSTPFFKIVNLSSSKKEKKYNVRLFDVNINFFSKDKIVLISDDQNYVNLFLDLIQNKVQKESGNIYFKNSGFENGLTDVYEKTKNNFFKKEVERNVDRNNLMEINYSKIARFDKKTLEHIIKKIANFYKINLRKNFLYNVLDTFKLLKFLNLNFNDLNIYQRNRFMFFCDLLVNKKVIKVKDVSNDLTLSEKINFYRYLNDYFFNKDNILLFVSNDITEIKILANRAIVFSNENVRFNEYFKDIVKYYNSIDDYIVLSLKS